jgi:hypothetical protein
VCDCIGDCSHPLKENVDDISEVPAEAVIRVVQDEHLKQKAVDYQSVHENKYAIHALGRTKIITATAVLMSTMIFLSMAMVVCAMMLTLLTMLMIAILVWHISHIYGIHIKLFVSET